MKISQFFRSMIVRTAPLRAFGDADLTEHPHDLFSKWFTEADAAGLYLPEAMTLSTVAEDGQPSNRTVLLKGHGRDGFDFYTNRTSQKAEELEGNNKCALLFHWNTLHRQIRIQGTSTPLPDSSANEYFASRPRQSQIGAWASNQSQPLKSREELTNLFHTVEKKFKSKAVHRPPHWGGYRIDPSSYEFWQGRAGRLHDRYRYDLNQTDWKIQRLAP